MALFHKERVTNTTARLYTIGLQKAVMVVGLGNPGKEYQDTRHNAGFLCIDFFADKQGFDGWTEKKDLRCLITSQLIADSRVILVKPTTYMNLSGEAVQAIQNFYKLRNHATLVIHDELDIPYG